MVGKNVDPLSIICPKCGFNHRPDSDYTCKANVAKLNNTKKIGKARSRDMVCPFCLGSKKIVYSGYGVQETQLCEKCSGTGKVRKDMFTCYTCGEREICGCAYDAFNVDGSCLAEETED